MHLGYILRTRAFTLFVDCAVYRLKITVFDAEPGGASRVAADLKCHGMLPFAERERLVCFPRSEAAASEGLRPVMRPSTSTHKDTQAKFGIIPWLSEAPTYSVPPDARYTPPTNTPQAESHTQGPVNLGLLCRAGRRMYARHTDS